MVDGIFFVQYGNRNDADALIDFLFEDESCDLNTFFVVFKSYALDIGSAGVNDKSFSV